jgi:hypothetical protein
MEKTGGCGVGGCGASRPRKLEWFGAIGGVRTSNMSVRLLVCPRSRVMETHTPSSSASKFLMTRDPDARTASTSALASRRSVAMAGSLEDTRDETLQNLRSTPLPRGRAPDAPRARFHARETNPRVPRVRSRVRAQPWMSWVAPPDHTRAPKVRRPAHPGQPPRK